MEGDNDFLFACVCMPPFGPHATRPDIPTQVHVIFPLPSNAVHLAYKLEVPLQAGPAQAVFKVEDEGDMALSIKASKQGGSGLLGIQGLITDVVGTWFHVARFRLSTSCFSTPLFHAITAEPREPAARRSDPQPGAGAVHGGAEAEVSDTNERGGRLGWDGA